MKRTIPYRLRCVSRTLQIVVVEGDLVMLHLAIVFLVIALIAALFGFVGVAGLAWEGAKILFVIFIILAVLSFLGHGFRRGHYGD